MDIWTIIAAAGAGYVAQHWNNIKANRPDVLNSPTENELRTLSESSPVSQKVLEKKRPFSGVLSGKKEEKCVRPDIDVASQDTHVEEAIINTFIRETLSFGNISYNIQHGERCIADIPQTHEDYDTLQPSKEGCLCCSPATSASALRARRLKGKASKPLTSLESCLMAQLYNEHAHTDDYVLDSVYLPRAPTNSPFVARGTSGMSRRSEGCILKFPVRIVEKPLARKFTYSKAEPISGIPRLPILGDLNLHKTSPRQTERSKNSSTPTNGKHLNTKGPPHGLLLFCLGVSAGILSSFLANQREVDKLNQLLRQKNNLVEDLQDELEMKDSLTVEELAVEDDESQATHHDSLYYGCSHSPEAKLDVSMEYDQGKYHDDEAEVESLSKIEAELEAELERLELSINTCSLEGKLSNLVELEPDFLPDVAVGELKADLFSRQTGSQAYADQEGGGNSTTHPSDYAVSPRELSLRLHEVIESRLEARVKELEDELQNRQRKFQLANYDHIESWRKFPSSDDVSSSNPASPVHENDPPCGSLPVVINLPDEAQETNEANDLFSTVNDSEDDKPHEITNSSGGISSHLCELSPCQAQEVCTESNIDRFLEEEAYNTMSFDLSSSRESDGDSEDEIEKLLIQHIVERARKQGSSVILDAQKALFCGNEDGQ